MCGFRRFRWLLPRFDGVDDEQAEVLGDGSHRMIVGRNGDRLVDEERRRQVQGVKSLDMTLDGFGSGVHPAGDVDETNPIEERLAIAERPAVASQDADHLRAQKT